MRKYIRYLLCYKHLKTYNMKFTALLLLQFIFTTNCVLACLNESRVLLNGEMIESDSKIAIPQGHDYIINRAHYEQELNHLKIEWEQGRKIDDYSDYGVVLVYLGKYKDALNVFQKIEAIMPGLYNTAANMGTAYELIGNNKLAYFWIDKAIKINPASHDSSEWLHLKILKAKIDEEKFLNSKFLIGTEFGNSTIPKSTLSIDKLKALKSSIYYQLNERISFIKPKDKIVALLLFELGNICAITDDATSAYEIYKKAAKYGYSTEIFNERLKFVKKLQLNIKKESKQKNILPQGKLYENPENNYNTFIFIGVGLIFSSIFLLLWWQRKKHSR